MFCAPQHEEEERALAARGVFFVGGPGAYIFEGKSGSGKNVLLENMLSKSLIPFENVVTLSTTQEETGSLDFIARFYDPSYWGVAKDINELMHVIDVRKDSLAKIKHKLGMEEKDAYIQRHPMLVIVDDIGGTTSTRNSEKNPWYTLFTTVRHLGIYLVVLIQYHKQIGPAFMGNTRALITFDHADDAIKHFANCSGVSLTTNDKKNLQAFLKIRHNFLIWWKTWSSENSLPDIPWLCGKITPGTNACTINNTHYQEVNTVKRAIKEEDIRKKQTPEFGSFSDSSDFDEMSEDD